MQQYFFPDIGVLAPEILLPPKNLDLKKWAVVACDQYTSQRDYWERIKKFIGQEPSTLNLIFPEVYLEDQDREERIKRINQAQAKYLAAKHLVKAGAGFVLLDRQTAHTPSRKGLVVALDLECYDYQKGSQTLIRATEGTIVDRLPPRVKIRENSPIELPHIMVLIDDPQKTVLEPLFQQKNLPLLYDFTLMENSGHLRGWHVAEENLIQQVAKALRQLADPSLFQKKYQVREKGVLLFAMGDGNHSLATAKAIWENLKKMVPDKKSILQHPARFALVELVNVHDAGLQFEPIHRVLFKLSPSDFFAALEAFFTQNGSTIARKTFLTKTELNSAWNKSSHSAAAQHFWYVTAQEYGLVTIKNPPLNLTVGSLQKFLDHYLRETTGVTIDYIHGEEVVERLGKEPQNIGFCLPPMSKQELFKTVIVDGALPRKTFSMGEADEKRFYLECRKITHDDKSCP